jgi:hypothetical protein
MTLTESNYDTLNVRIDEDKTYYIDDGEKAAEGDYDLVVLDSDMKAFDLGKKYDQIAFGMNNGPLMFYEDGKWKAVEETGTPITKVIKDTAAATQIAVWNGTSSGCVPYTGTNDTQYVNATPFYVNGEGAGTSVIYNFTAGSFYNTTLYRVTATNVSGAAQTIAAKDYGIVNGSGVICIIPADDLDEITHRVESLSVDYKINSDSDLDKQIVYSRTASDGELKIKEAIDPDGNNEISIRANINEADKAIESLTSDKDELTFMKWPSSAGNVSEEPLYITQKGSKFTAKDDTSATLKMAKKVGELQYYLKPVGAEVSAGKVTYNLGIGQTQVVSGLTMKLLDITDVGACSVTGGGCTASMGTVTAKLDTGETSKDVITPYPFTATDRLVVLDSEAPTAEKLILVGGPLVNTVTASTLAGTNVNITTPGTKIKQEVGNNIVIAGYTAADTTAAAAEFIAELLAKA